MQEFGSTLFFRPGIRPYAAIDGIDTNAQHRHQVVAAIRDEIRHDPVGLELDDFSAVETDKLPLLAPKINQSVTLVFRLAAFISRWSAWKRASGSAVLKQASLLGRS